MKKIYLAGPEVFLKNAKEVGKELKQLCSQYGFDGYFPLDNEIQGSNQQELASNIQKANIELIQACDIVIANLSPFRGPEPDSGTVWEVGYAQGLGKQVLGYCSDRRTLKEKTQAILDLGDSSTDSEGLEIEDFGLSHNLMFADIIMGSNFEECLQSLKENS